MKHKFAEIPGVIGITAAVLICLLLSGCSLNERGESREIQLPIERPEPVQTEEPSRPSNYQPGIPVTPSGIEDYISSSSSSSSSSTQPIPIRPPQSSSTEPEIVIPEPDRSSLLTDYTRKWGYNHLDSAQKTAYALLFNAVQDGEYGFEFPDRLIKMKLDKSDVKKIYWAFDYDNAQFIELGNSYQYSYQNTLVTAMEATDIRNDGNDKEQLYDSFTAAAQNVLNEALRQPEGYEQLLFIHDWIVNNTEYRRNGPDYISEADGAIVYGLALCEGYSKAFMYLAQALGYNCVCIVGRGNGESHMWNMVELDGKWYHVDVTWDDPTTSDGSNALRHDYFLVSDKTIDEDHYIENPFTRPKAKVDYQR